MIQKNLFYLFMLLPFLGFAKNGNEKIDQSLVGKLKRDVETLAADNMGGRMTGSEGETLAANYIESRFQEIGIAPYKSKYKWDFTFKDGKKIGSKAYFKIFENKLNLNSELISMPYGNGDKFMGAALPNVDEPDNVWLVSLKKLKLQESNTPFKVLYEKAKECEKLNAKAVVFFNDIDATFDINLLNHPKYETLGIPVVVINYKAYAAYIKPNLKKDWIEIEARLGYEDANITGKNVLAMIDNNAPLTIVLGAHYDHLGINEAVYNGANNNASGIASLLSLAEMIKANNLTHYNYLFVAFSGSEFNFQGSSAFLKQNDRTSNMFSCMIELNKLGRFNSYTKSLYISGVGTSTLWLPLLQQANKLYSLKIDSTGIGYGDYINFYKKNIPVLSFSTGYNSDYAMPTDDVSKINYAGQADINYYIFNVVHALDGMSKLNFTQGTNIIEKLENLNSDLGFIPDFSYQENGIKIAACLRNKLAEKAGLECDDVILKIAEFKIIDFDDYIQAMNKLEKGREIMVTVLRGKNEFKFFLTL